MDIPTYDAYASFGTDVDAKDNPIQLVARRHLPQLNNAEHELYDRVTDPAWEGYRRGTAASSRNASHWRWR